MVTSRWSAANSLKELVLSWWCSDWMVRSVKDQHHFPESGALHDINGVHRSGSHFRRMILATGLLVISVLYMIPCKMI